MMCMMKGRHERALGKWNFTIHHEKEVFEVEWNMSRNWSGTISVLEDNNIWRQSWLTSHKGTLNAEQDSIFTSPCSSPPPHLREYCQQPTNTC